MISPQLSCPSLDVQRPISPARGRAHGSQSYKNNGPCPIKQTIPQVGGMSLSKMFRGPYPMHEVVLMAVSAAVRTDITSWITDFQKSLFFIIL